MWLPEHFKWRVARIMSLLGRHCLDQCHNLLDSGLGFMTWFLLGKKKRKKKTVSLLLIGCQETGFKWDACEIVFKNTVRYSSSPESPVPSISLRFHVVQPSRSKSLLNSYCRTIQGTNTWKFLPGSLKKPPWESPGIQEFKALFTGESESWGGSTRVTLTIQQRCGAAHLISLHLHIPWDSLRAFWSVFPPLEKPIKLTQNIQWHYGDVKREPWWALSLLLEI